MKTLRLFLRKMLAAVITFFICYPIGHTFIPDHDMGVFLVFLLVGIPAGSLLSFLVELITRRFKPDLLLVRFFHHVWIAVLLQVVFLPVGLIYVTLFGMTLFVALCFFVVDESVRYLHKKINVKANITVP